MNTNIQINGAKTNNLKNVHVSIPKGKITVVAGLSGSGKSSLVFDTLAAESQRLLNETYSSYIQQILPHYEKPPVDQITNLPVSLVITQKKMGGNARSTVGTVTDIYTGLRLLFSRIGTPFIGYSMVYSFNNPQGMCQKCEGLGEIQEFKLENLLDYEKTLNEGAIHFPTFQPGGWRLTRYTESGYFDNDKKLREYTPAEMNRLLYDSGSKPQNASSKFPKTGTYVGLIERIKKTMLEKNSSQYQANFAQILHTCTCPLCNGTRVNEHVRSVTIHGKSIGDCVQMSLTELYDFLSTISQPNVTILLADLQKRLTSLISVGLGYLNIGRQTATLSGGESQRIKMTKHLNSALTDVLYIFDEPSVGLHPEDILGINRLFTQLKEKGNTVVLVDHDPAIIKLADHIIEMGPTAGEEGGSVIFSGSYNQLLQANTMTANALSQPHSLNDSKKHYKDFYVLKDVSAYTVKHQSVKIPKNSLTVVSGVAGSGKSTLIRNLFAAHYPESILFDQSPIHGSNRSNLLTYLGIFDKIRQKYAEISGKNTAFLSFNGKGACPECKGKGFIKYDLAYMGDVVQKCEKCQGNRYNDEALSVFWHGKNIVELLQLTVEAAVNTFTIPAVQTALTSLIEANLGYIKLGQSLNTLSGGETQRLKIAAKLIDVQLTDTPIFILDEPSIGLHEIDIAQLLLLLSKLKNMGKTLIVLEHKLSIISQADWVIDMGPKGGNEGGNVLFAGPPTELLQQKNSYTAKHLRHYLD